MHADDVMGQAGLGLWQRLVRVWGARAGKAGGSSCQSLFSQGGRSACAVLCKALGYVQGHRYLPPIGHGMAQPCSPVEQGLDSDQHVVTAGGQDLAGRLCRRRSGTLQDTS